MLLDNDYRLVLADKLDAQIVEENGCHIYKGHIDCLGRGRMWWRGLDGRGSRVHDKACRIAYALKNGKEIPAGKQAHHICVNPACANADHIMALTWSEHVAEHKRLRAEAKALNV